jgi:hypothetical protein
VESLSVKDFGESDGDKQKDIQQEIKKQVERKEVYKDLENKLKKSGEIQISISDPESRQIILRNNITEVAYNVQIHDRCQTQHSCRFQGDK